VCFSHDNHRLHVGNKGQFESFPLTSVRELRARVAILISPRPKQFRVNNDANM
jgi:hypothetical protein